MCDNIYFRGILIELLGTKGPKDEGENCGMFLFLGKQKESSPGYGESVSNLSRGCCGRWSVAVLTVCPSPLMTIKNWDK